MYLVRSLRTFIGTNTERTAAGLNAFLSGDEYIETDTSSIYIHDGMAWLLNPGGSPGGSDTQVQFNDGGTLGGDGALVWNNTSKIIELTKSNADTSVPFIQIDNTGGGNASIEITTTGDSATIGFESGGFLISAASSSWIMHGTQMHFFASDTLLLSGHSLPALSIQHTGASQYETVINPISTDIDFRSSGDTATHLLVTDAGLDAVQIGTTVAGDIADFRSTGIVFNNSESNRDFRIAGNGVTNGYFYDGGNNRHGFGTDVPAFPIHSIYDNGNNSAFETYSNTAAVGAVHILRKGRGSFASPGTVQNGDTLGGFAFGGYQSGFHNPILITGIVTENWTGTAHGAKISFATTVNGSTARTEKMSLYAGLTVGSPTGGDKGVGTINAVAVYDDNTLLTDFVFEDDYQLLPIKEMKKFFTENKHLPTIPGRKVWESEGKFSLGKLANYLWETIEVQAIYISQLNDRLTALEGLN
jgi:hypothetical protein